MFWKERNLSDGALDWQRGKRRKEKDDRKELESFGYRDN